MRACVALALFLGGCSAAFVRPALVPGYAPALAARYAVPTWREPYDLAISRQKRIERDRVLDELSYLADVAYTEYEGGVTQGRAGFEMATDLLILGLGTGAALAAPGTQAAMALAGAGIVGGRSIASKGVWGDVGQSAIIARMRSLRRERYVAVAECRAQPVRDCPLELAIVKLSDYHAAGALLSALQAISEDAGRVTTTATIRADAAESARVEEGD